MGINGKVHKMSADQEQALINYLADNKLNGTCGSSRRVYFMGNAKNKKFLSELFGLPTTNEYVVKVACGFGGINQNQNEIEAYLDYGEDYNLAPIVAYGTFCIIMDYVESPEDFEDILFECNTSEDCAFTFYLYYKLQAVYDDEKSLLTAAAEKIDLNTKIDNLRDVTLGDLYKQLYEDGVDQYIASEAANAIEQLCYENKFVLPIDGPEITKKREEFGIAISIIRSLDDLFGDTTDNAQIGIDLNNGRYVCYDYGFRGDSWGANTPWSSDITDENSVDYLLFIKNLLNDANLHIFDLEDLDDQYFNQAGM